MRLTSAEVTSLSGCGGGGEGSRNGDGSGTGISNGTFNDGDFIGTTRNTVVNQIFTGVNIHAAYVGGDDVAVNTGGGARTIAGGAGDDTIDDGEGVDIAVSAGALAGNQIVAALNDGWSESFTVDDRDADSDGGEGTDTLNDIEVLRFGTTTFVVVEYDYDGTETDSEVTLGEGMPNGEGTDAVDGGAGDDPFFCCCGDAVLSDGGSRDGMVGGPVDDAITGGARDGTLNVHSAMVLEPAGEIGAAVFLWILEDYTVSDAKRHGVAKATIYRWSEHKGCPSTRLAGSGSSISARWNTGAEQAEPAARWPITRAERFRNDCCWNRGGVLT